jgi:flagellar basal-body rod protein FlgF
MPIALIPSMASGIWPAVSGASVQAQNVDMISNNLANADTLAFKKDLPTFHEYLASKEREHGGQEVPRGPIKDKDFYQLDGRDQSFVILDSTYTNFTPGHMRVTQAPLDIALDGQGFIEVSTPVGVRYTRQGNLHIEPEGKLVTTEGYPVLASAPGGLSGQQPPLATNTPGVNRDLASSVSNDKQAPLPEASRFINLRDRGTNFSISPQGEIYAGDDLISKLSVVEFQDTRKLRKGAGLLFNNPDPQNLSKEPSKTVVHQGVLETSNVNPIEEMSNLIKANRLFEHDLKAIKTYGEMMQREANDIGKL